MSIKLVIVDSNIFKDIDNSLSDSIKLSLESIDAPILCLSSESNESKTSELISPLGISDCFDVIYPSVPIARSIIDLLHVSMCHPEDCLVVYSSIRTDDEVKHITGLGVNLGRSDNPGSTEIANTVHDLNSKWFTLYRYVRDMQSGLAGTHLTDFSRLAGHYKKSKAPMYANIVRDFIKIYSSKQRKFVMEVGTGRGQLLTAMRLSSQGSFILSYDIDASTNH